MSVVEPEVFALGHYPVTYGAKLLNSDGTVRDLTGYSKLDVVFVRPDGSTLIKAAVPKDPSNLVDTEIIYANSTSPSILDQRNKWRFTVVAHFGSLGVIPSHESVGFWVV